VLPITDADHRHLRARRDPEAQTVTQTAAAEVRYIMIAIEPPIRTALIEIAGIQTVSTSLAPNHPKQPSRPRTWPRKSTDRTTSTTATIILAGSHVTRPPPQATPSTSASAGNPHSHP
jgi:hypothetical protein